MTVRLKTSDVVFIALVAAVITGISLLPSPKDNNPPTPTTPAHHGLTREKDCLACHVQDGARPLAERHPKRPDCFRCHRQGL